MGWGAAGCGHPGHGHHPGHGYHLAPGGGWQGGGAGCSDGSGGDGGDGGWGFGVRRPLRFLAHKLELDERQVAALAKIIDDLKTERAQAEVDRRRTMAAFADAVGGASFDPERAREGGQLRVDSASRLRDAVVKALERIHALLDDEQRERLAYLIRTGALVL